MLDIIEIDAASNTGVDNIRDLIEKARFEPNQGKYKVYIIDEVHMLSTGAFNALLKTLEEPPAHVKFILATTEVDKVPETIRSRALRFDFRKITEADIIDRLKFVISEEKIQAEEAAIKIIAKYARGGLRDALTLLEQNTIDSELSLEHVRMTLSLLEESQIDAVIESLKESDVVSIMNTTQNLRDIHVSARGFFEQVMYRLRDLMIEHLDDGLYHTYQELYEYFESAYTRVRAIPDGMLLIEMTLLKIVKRGGRKEEIGDKIMKSEVKKETKIDESNLSGVGGEKKTKAQNGESEGDKLSESDESNRVMSGANERPFRSEAEIGSTLGVLLSPSGAFGTFQSWKVHEKKSGFLPPQEWQKRVESNTKIETQSLKTTPQFSYIVLLEALKSTKPALVIDLKTARFELDGTKLILIFPKNWNYTRVNTAEMKNTITETLIGKFGGEWSVECRLDESKIQASLVDDVF